MVNKAKTAEQNLNNNEGGNNMLKKGKAINKFGNHF
jgi:hypothetical protein